MFNKNTCYCTMNTHFGKNSDILSPCIKIDFILNTFFCNNNGTSPAKDLWHNYCYITINKHNIGFEHRFFATLCFFNII